MSDVGDDSVRIKAEPLREAVRAICRAGGSNEREAGLVADHLVAANLAGHDSHGVGMLPTYIANVLANELVVNQTLDVVLDTGSMLVCDGGAGYGQVMARDAVAHAIERAQKGGSCILALRNSHHIGRIGHWTEQCLAAGLVSLHFVNVLSTEKVAPFGGKKPKLVTNPISIGIPREGHEPIVIDFATSKLAMGKMRVAFNKGQQVPPGTLIDADGEPTTDPGVLFNPPLGALLPFGEHKGWCLALACELLGGALTGGKTMSGPRQRLAVINNMFSVIVSPEKLGTEASFAREIESFVSWAQEPPAGEEATVLLPGDPERRYKAQREAAGIPIDPVSWSQIVEAGVSVGLSAQAIEGIAGLG